MASLLCNARECPGRGVRAGRWVESIHPPSWVPEAGGREVPSAMQPALPPGIQLTETLEKMQQGTLMRKVKSKSWKKQRYFKLQDDCMTIWYQSKRTGKTESACEYQLWCVVCAGR